MLNLGTRGVGASVGRRGARVSVGHRGVPAALERGGVSRSALATAFAPLLLAALALAGCAGESAGLLDATSEAVDTGGLPVEAAATTAAEEPARPARRTFVVAKVIDGDTIELGNGRRVRLVQIDAPELQEGECYGQEAKTVLSRILPQGTRVTLEADPRLDDLDRYGRLLRHVFKGSRNVNLAMVRRGAASVWFFEGDRGRYAKRLLDAAEQARDAGRGLWGACPAARLTPERGIETGVAEPEPPAAQPPPPEPPPAAEPPASAGCDPSYPDFCILPPPPDLDCADIGTSFTVVGSDPHGFDREGDGVGCESYG